MSDLERAQVWLVRLGAFLLPLVILWSTNDPVVLPKLLVARALILLLGALVLVRRLRGEFRVRRTPLDLPVLAYVASAGLSTLLAPNMNLAFFGAYGRLEGFLTIVTYAALFWLTIQSLSRPVDARGVLTALLAGAFIVSVIAVLQAVAGALVNGPSSGAAHAVATFGNSNALAAYLAMAIPLGVGELMHAGSSTERLVAGNVVVTMAIALLLTFGRGGWAGTAVGVAVVLAAARPSPRLVVTVGAVAAGLVAAILLAVTLASAGGPSIAHTAAARIVSLLDPIAGTGAIRLHIWRDTLGLIASRPLVGYGPDTFGMVFSTFQTGSWSGVSIIDESHSELLQIAATQGLAGLAAFAWLCMAFLRLWWTGRHQTLASGCLGAGVGYLLTLLVNFSAVPAALPFWIFLGAAAILLQGGLKPGPAPAAANSRRRRPVQLAAGLLVLAILALVAIAMPYAADSRFHDALAAFAAGDRARAAILVADARSLQPRQQVYAAAGGNVALAGSDWVRAREAYLTAAELGSFDPSVFRQLAIADEHLGLQAEAVAAARRSVALDRFDQRNVAVLQEVTSGPAG